MKELLALTLKLCNVHGTPGCEEPAMLVAKDELYFCEDVNIDKVSGLSAFFGSHSAERQIMLDAHIDQIGMTVTEIDEAGFLHLTKVGGIDQRTMPGSLVTVFGATELSGIVCCLPPHISDGGDTIKEVQEQAVDIGLGKEEADKLVAVGDRVILKCAVRPLLGNRVSGTALDDRAGCASIIRAMQLLRGEKLNCGVHISLSTREEVGGQGAQIQAYKIHPTEAIAVDVSFAKQPGVDKPGLGELGKGPMIGLSASLSRQMSSEFIALAKKEEIPYQLEAMGGETGTNCDSIGTVHSGVPCALLSIPQRNMHTPSEVCDLQDVKNVARLIAAYIKEAF